MTGTNETVRERSREELERKEARLRSQVERLRIENEGLRAEIERLQRELQSALSANKRQAAPYSKGKRVAKPKRPGRKAGQGKWARRGAPPAEQVKGPPVEVPVTETACSKCGGELELEGTEEASVTDLPPWPKPEATVYRIEIRRCRGCGRRNRGRHPDVPEDQRGATAHRVGPRAMAAAHVLHYSAGLPLRKVPMALRELTGITITQGALTQDALRRTGAEVGAAYDELRASVREAPVVYTDDTGWRLGGEPAQLMAFDTNRATVYQIRSQHRNEEVRELVPSNYAGTMVTDRGKSYDAEELQRVAQQKCLAHILRNASVVLDTKSGRARTFGLRLKGILRDAIALGKQRALFTPAEFEIQITEIAAQLTWHLRHRKFTDPDNQRLLNGIGLQHDYGRLLRFLHVPGVEPTNNRAERVLRPAVIARKVSHCSKNDAGALAFAAFTSVIRTAVKNGCASLTDSLHTLFTAPPQPRAPT